MDIIAATLQHLVECFGRSVLYTNEMRFLSFKLERGIRTAANWNRNESNAWVYIDIVS